jgi:hypothetical protein
LGPRDSGKNLREQKRKQNKKEIQKGARKEKGN